VKPARIVVCGAPASGKTTLARRLATDLQLPLLEQDVIKESLAEVLPMPDRAASRQIGAASMSVLYDLADAMLARGVNTMIESNFYAEYAARDLVRMSRSARVCIVQCEVDRDNVVQRYRQRHADGERHAAHFDLDALSDLIAGLHTNIYDLTAIGYHVIAVNTDDGYQPHDREILQSILHHFVSHE